MEEETEIKNKRGKKKKGRKEEDSEREKWKVMSGCGGTALVKKGIGKRSGF